MKKLIVLSLSIIFAGCTSIDDRVCLDWDSSIDMVEDCTPLYGSIICVTKEKPRYWCALYAEPEGEIRNEDRD